MRSAAGLGAAIALLWTFPAGAADLTAGQVAEALKRHVCFSRVWWGDPYARLGQTVTVDVRLAGATAFAWSEDMRVPRTPKWADSYVIVDRSAGPVVTQRSGYNIDLLRGEAAYERDRRRVYGGQSQRLKVELPATCDPPRFDAESPLKAEMRAVVMNSLTNAVRTWGRRPARGQVRVSVANFNIDYPEAFALREDTGEVLRISLHSADPTSYVGGRGRQYAVTPTPRGPTAIALRRLIQKHGRTQTIRVR